MCENRDAEFVRLYNLCIANKCAGCENCNNCKHGTDINMCEVCNPPTIYKCKHGNGDDCETCEEIAQAQDDADAYEESECEHGVSGGCWDCAAEDDRLAQHAKDRDDWNHFHPSTPE